MLDHGNGRHHPRRPALGFERLPERQAVQHRGEHAHIVAAHPVHAVGGGGEAAIDVAAADHEAKLDAEAGGLAHVAGDAVQHVHVDAVAVLAHQGLAGQLDEDPAVAWRSARARVVP